MNYDGEIVIGTQVDTSGAEDGIDELAKLLSNGQVFKKIGRDEMGNALVEGISVAINESAVDMTEQFEKAFTELELKKDMSLVSEAEYYAQLEELRDNYLGKGSAKWWEYTAKIIEGWFKLGVKELKDVEPLEKAAENKTDTKPKENYAGYDKEAYKKSLDEDYK